MNAVSLFKLGFTHWQAILLSFIPALITLSAIVYFSRFLFNRLNKTYLFYLVCIFAWQLNDTLCRMSIDLETAQSWNRLLIFVYIMQFPAWLHCTFLLTRLPKLSDNNWLLVSIYVPSFVFSVLLCAGLYTQSFSYSAFWGWSRNFYHSPILEQVTLLWTIGLSLLSVVTLGLFAYKSRLESENKFISRFIFFGYLVPLVASATTDAALSFFLNFRPFPLASTLMVTIIAVMSQLIRYKIFNLSETIDAEHIANLIQENIFVVTPDLQVTYINEYAQNTSGTYGTGVRHLRDVFPHSNELYEAFKDRVIEPGFKNMHPANFKFSGIGHGKEIHWHTTTYPISTRKKVNGLLVVSRDIANEIQLAQSRLASLRSQMNPHFIFNALNSVRYYIHNNQRAQAEEFLSSFAILIRQILDNSSSSVIPLADEFITLKLYLELEKARLKEQLTYEIKLDAGIDAEDIMIPSMLIQPYVENAIIHGLVPKKQPGLITIALIRQNDTIVCLVKDDGVGRKRSAEISTKNLLKKKSHGMSITRARLDLLNEEMNIPVAVNIIDLEDADHAPAGTEVEICIPLLERF